MGVAQMLLKALMCSKRAKSEHKWTAHAEALVMWGVLDITARGIVVGDVDGSRTIDFDRGLTEDHWQFFAPILEGESFGGWEQAMLAEQVLRHEAAFPAYHDWATAWWLLGVEYDDSEDDWLPRLVEENGFQRIVGWMKDAVERHRRTKPRPCLKISFVKTPRWDGKWLMWGNDRWPVRDQLGPLQQLLNALENNKWPPSVLVADLDPDQVRDVAKYLRLKTKGFIKWSAALNGTFSWSIP